MITLVKPDNTVIQLDEDVNFWWVNQGKMYDYELSNGFIESRPDDCLEHHLTLKVLQVGDIIVHYANMYIRAISVVKQPFFYTTDHRGDHRRVHTIYYPIINHIHRDVARSNISRILGYSPKPPYRRTGDLQLGYLYHLSGNLTRVSNFEFKPPSSFQKTESCKAFIAIMSKIISIY